MLPSNVKLVAALDVGTTCSGYAYSFTGSPDEINLCSFKGRPPDIKTSSALLLNKAGRFVAYGHEAEDQFAQQCKQGDMSHRLFRNFKMNIHHNSTLTKASTVQDISGQYSMPVFDLLVMSVHYLKNHMMRQINRLSGTYNEDHVYFVLLVPAIFDDRAKWLMREVALKAGMKPEMFTMALESETSSLWCQHEDIDGIRKKGSQYITVDLGGGTADIAAHESCGDGSVESLTSTCGGDWGAIHIDNCFKSYLALLFGTQSVDDLMKQNLNEWYKLIMDYEASKVSEANGGTLELGLNIPQCLKQSAVDNKGLHGAHELAELIKSPNFGGHFRLIGQRLEIDLEATRGMYSYTVNSVVGKLEEFLQEGAVCTQNIDHVIFVGGVSINESIRTMFQSNLKRHRVTFPSGGEMFSMKGAVLHGYNQTLVQSRVVPLTYGIRSTVPYDDSKHAGGETVTLNGVKMCTDNFHVLMKAGTKLNMGYEVRELDKPLSADDTEQQFYIYSCGAADDIPSLVTQYTMHKEASFSVPLPFGCLVEDKMFERAVIFGKTDISFRITFQKRTKNVFISNMNYD